MTKIGMVYLQASGRCRMASASNETRSPGFLLNHLDKQAHSLNDSPVFSRGELRRFKTWEEFLVADPPPPEHSPDKTLCVCEEGNPWPLSFNEMADLDDRALQFAEWQNQAEQGAYAGAVRETYNASLMRTWSIAALMVFCIVSAVIVLLAIQSNFGKSAALPFLMGITLVRPRTQSSGVPAAPQAKKKGWFRSARLKDWEWVIQWDHFGGKIVWGAELPLRVIYDHVPPDCRYTFENATARRISGAVCGGGSLLIALGVFWFWTHSLFWTILVPPLIAAGALAWGYFKGYSRFMPPPVWFVRRIGVETKVVDSETGEITSEVRPVILGITHTMGTGIPPEVAPAVRKERAIKAFQAYMARRRQSQGNPQMNGHQGSGEASTLNVRLSEFFEPCYYNSLSLYEIIRGKDVKEEFKDQMEKSKDKLEKFSMAGMALGSIALLIVVWLLFGNA